MEIRNQLPNSTGAFGAAALLFVFLSFQPHASAQLANSAPSPLWLSSKADAKEGMVIYEKHFDYSGKLLKAILLVAGEAKVSVSVNGKKIAEVESKDRAVSIDATKHLREGDNVLTLQSTRGVAALMELNGDLARRQWVVSDETWKASPGTLVARSVAIGDPNANLFDFKKTFDAYNSWQMARPENQNLATDASTFTLPEGFKAEIIRSATPEEGSWVAMAFDPKGRLTLAREKKGLLRVTLKGSQIDGVEVINDTLLECRGLLYAGGALYANANNSKGLYRLRDPKGEDKFDEVTELLHTEGGVGHGRNHIKLGPDGKIYMAHGNNVLLPSSLTSTAARPNYSADQILPNPWDGSMFDGNVELPAGHVLRMNPDGTQVEMVAGGFRNPLDLAFNREGDIFTFDADMERDVGAPWYMPTRVLQVVPGADYGWRRGTGRFLAWYPETLPSVLDIGLSSPTGVFFGYGAKFPAKYEEAFFILDWSYGRIIAVHLSPKGAGYSGTQETFVSGRPLNVTDGCIGPDGALWFVTGGRGTQSGLYRVTYTGKLPSSEIAAKVQSNPMHLERRNLERMLTKPEVSDEELKQVLKSLSSEDRFLSHASRVVLERTAPERWSLNSLSGQAWLQGALALVRNEHKASRDEILGGLLQQMWRDEASPQSSSEKLRLLELVFIRLGAPDDEERKAWLHDLEGHYLTSKDEPANRELCKLLVYLLSPAVIEKTVAFLESATSSEDLIHYPLFLRYVKDGWTMNARRVVFDALNRAEKMNGASTYFKAIQDTRNELAASLKPEEYQKLAEVIIPKKSVQLSNHALPGHTFKNWKLEDLIPSLDQVSKGRSFEKAKAALITTQCVFCHRVSNDPSLPAGILGPDLSQVSSRFNRRDLLESILNPSKVIDEKFRSLTLTLSEGKVITGSLENEDDERVVLRTNPLSADKTEIAKSMIKDRKLSDISPMPAGLFNSLKPDQILDILAYFESGGDPKHKNFQ